MEVYVIEKQFVYITCKLIFDFGCIRNLFWHVHQQGQINICFVLEKSGGKDFKTKNISNEF